MNHAALDSLLTSIGAGFTPDNQKLGLAIFHRMRMSRKISVVGALIQEHTDDTALCAEIDEILKSAQQYTERRNRFVHSMWIVPEEEEQLVSKRVKTKRGQGIREEDEVVPVSEINDLADGYNQVVTDLKARISELNDATYGFTIPSGF